MILHEAILLAIALALNTSAFPFSQQAASPPLAAAPAVSPAAVPQPQQPAAASPSPATPFVAPSSTSPSLSAFSGAASSTVMTKDEFAKAVAALGNAGAASKADAFMAALPDAKITTKREAAMFLAQMAHESLNLKAVEEIACTPEESKKAACDASYPLQKGGVPGKHYYGRGYIQLTWDYNYQDASRDLFGDDRLLKDPDQVAKDDSIAWRTAAWFWGKKVHPNPDVQAGKLGAATKIINGGLECSGQSSAVPKKRFENYKKIMAALGEAVTPDAESGCYPLT